MDFCITAVGRSGYERVEWEYMTFKQFELQSVSNFVNIIKKFPIKSKNIDKYK